jgi:hypothetical protein
MDISTLDTATLSRNVVHQSPSDGAPRPRRTETSVPLRKGRKFENVPPFIQSSGLRHVKTLKACDGASNMDLSRRHTLTEWEVSSKIRTKYLATERTGNQLQGKCTGLLWTVKKGKAVPLEAWSGPEGSRKLRFPDFLTTAQDGGKVVSLTYRPHLPPGNTLGTHFCYRLGRPQGHSAIRRNYVNEKFHDTIRDRTSDLPICSVYNTRKNWHLCSYVGWL